MFGGEEVVPALAVLQRCDAAGVVVAEEPMQDARFVKAGDY